jgi:VWFA-related protein
MAWSLVALRPVGITLAAGARLQQQPAPTFKSGVDFVNVDVTVTDQQGRPVEDLPVSAFEVYEDGQLQQVSTFSLVKIPFSPARPAADASSPERIEPDVRSNDPATGGRVYILLLDDLHVAPLRSGLVKSAARTFVERHLTPNDIAAILYTSGRSDASQEFTSSPSLLLRSIDKFMGRKLRSAMLERLDAYNLRPDEETRADMRMNRIADPLALMRADQAKSMLATLTSVADLLSRSSGQRKAVLLFSEGLDYELQMGAVQTSSGLTTFTNVDAPVLLEELRQMIRASARANVTIYGVDPRGLAPTGEELIEVTSLPQNPLLGLTIDNFEKEVRMAQDSLRILSEHTGGTAAVSSNDLAGAFDRIVADNSTYYLLGYRSTNPKQDGSFRKIEVRVGRPGVRVRARSGYTASAPKGKESRLLTEAVEPSPALREAFNSPLPMAGLPLRAFAVPFQGEKGSSVLVGVEVDASTFRFEQKDGLFTDTLEVAIVALDGQAKFKSGDRHRIDLRLKPSTHAAVLARGLRLLFRLALPPGRFQLRAAAHESGSGATGSVFYDLEVPDFTKAALAISGLVLTTSGAADMPTARPDAGLQKALSTPPTASRRFRRDETMTVLFEVYGSPIGRADLEVVTTVKGADGRGLFRSESQGAGGEAGGGNRLIVPIALADLAPGRYTVGVEARDRRAPGRLATRAVPFEIIARGQ